MLKLAKPYFGLRGGWLTFWITLACGADMTLYGYDQVRSNMQLYHVRGSRESRESSVE